jgi:hypothetical protein
VGRSHGALRADIYGCLYFYLSEQLRTFADRLSRFRLNFRIFSLDARELSRNIRQGALAEHGVPSTIRFDRIDTSNILDVEYVGISGVLDNWGPLLEQSKHAKIVGYFMNWALRQEGGSPKLADESVSKTIIRRVLDLEGMVRWSLHQHAH